MTTALVVDDKSENIYLLEVILKGHGYQVQSAANGVEALQLARQEPPEIVIADILMPVMDGFALCREWKQDPQLKSIPFVFYTATYTDTRDEQFARDLGADEFIVKPMEPDAFLQKIETAVANHRTNQAQPAPVVSESVLLKEYNAALIRKLEDKMTALEQTNQALIASEAALIRAYESTLEGWSKALELRDTETNGHTERTVSLSEELGRELGLPEEMITQIRRGALLHDIGKMAIPDKILLKRGALDEEEWDVMRQHTTYAYQLLASIEFLRPALSVPYCHHEKWDGTGYPRGLKGEEIPLIARIFAIVDVFDALRSERPYRPPWPRDRIIGYIRDQAGKHFDPNIVPIFLRIVEEEGL